MKKVCVLMSTYNGEKYIEEQINSILNQKGNFKLSLIVRDDGSNDNTIHILEQYKKDGKITWYSGENLKPAKSFIDLIFTSGSDYDYYAFSDQDDWWDENKIEKAIEKIDDTVPCIYYSNPELVDDRLNSLGRKVYKHPPIDNFESVICGINAIGCSMLFNKKLYCIIRESERPRIIFMHDAYISKVCVSVGGRIIFDNESYLKYRQHSSNVIGVKTNIIKKITSFIKGVFIKNDISISEQAKEIMQLYNRYISDYNKKWLMKVSLYQNNIISRLSLAVSPKLKYSSIRMKFLVRISILLGNR